MTCSTRSSPRSSSLALPTGRYGAIAATADGFLLHLDEIGSGMSGVDLHATVGARQADLRRWATLVPPDTLGVPPRDDVTDGFLAALSKQDTAPGAGSANGAGVINGTPAAPGVASGPARVARRIVSRTPSGAGMRCSSPA